MKAVAEEILGQHFQSSCGIPLYYMSEEYGVVHRFTNIVESCDIVYSGKSLVANLKARIDFSCIKESVVVLGTEDFMLFAVVPSAVKENDFWLIGPALTFSFDVSGAESIAQKYEIADSQGFAETARYKLRRISLNGFINIAKLLYLAEWEKEAVDVVQDLMELVPKGMEFTAIPTLSTQDNICEMWTMLPTDFSEVVKYIMEGDSAAALNVVDNKRLVFIQNPGFFQQITKKTIPQAPDSADGLRDARMTMRAMASRIAYNVTIIGFDEMTAWLMWYYYLEKCDNAKTVQEINNIIRTMIVDYADRCLFITGKDLSNIVQKSVLYVKANLGSDISVSSIADSIKVNPRYLAETFRKEMGISINQYVFREKMMKAQVLLIYSNRSIIDIACELNYSSQSYFTSKFKQYSKLTPQRFRKKFRTNSRFLNSIKGWKDL